MLFHRCSILILMEMSSIHHFLHSRYLDLIIEYLSSVGQGSSEFCFNLPFPMDFSSMVFKWLIIQDGIQTTNREQLLS